MGGTGSGSSKICVRLVPMSYAGVLLPSDRYNVPFLRVRWLLFILGTHKRHTIEHI